MNDLFSFLPLLLKGLLVTLQVAFGGVGLGLILGLLFTAGERSRLPWLASITFSVLTGLRSVPELFILFAIYFGGTAVSISPITASIVGLGLIFGAYSAQVFRGALAMIPVGQRESAKALGCSERHIFQRILLPQVWRKAWPGLGNLWLVLLKDSSLVALVGVPDLLNTAQLAASHTRQPFLFYMAAAFLYLMITSVSLVFLKYGEKKWR